MEDEEDGERRDEGRGEGYKTGMMGSERRGEEEEECI